MKELQEFGLEFLAIVALVLFVVLLQKVFEYFFKRKLK